MMKHLWICLFALLPFLAHAQEANEGVSAGDRMPSFNIVHDDGTTVTSASFKGKVILVNFFATWCPPCQKELAEIQQTLWPKYKDNPDFALLVIGREHSDADLQAYNKKKGFSFPLYPDKNRSIYAAFAKNLIPRCYLIDQKGTIVYTTKGYDEKEFSTLMNQKEALLK